MFSGLYIVCSVPPYHPYILGIRHQDDMPTFSISSGLYDFLLKCHFFVSIYSLRCNTPFSFYPYSLQKQKRESLLRHPRAEEMPRMASRVEFNSIEAFAVRDPGSRTTLHEVPI